MTTMTSKKMSAVAPQTTSPDDQCHITTLDKIFYYLILLPTIVINTILTYLVYYPSSSSHPSTLGAKQKLAVVYLQAQRKTLSWKLLRWTTSRVGTGEAVMRYCYKHPDQVLHEIVKLDAVTVTVTEEPTSDGDAEIGEIEGATLHILTPVDDGENLDVTGFNWNGDGNDGEKKTKEKNNGNDEKDGPGRESKDDEDDEEENGGARKREERRRRRVLVYFHGGGYVNPLREAAHMPFILGCGRAARVARIVVVEYGLAPKHPYPTQLVQCIEAVRYVLSSSFAEEEEMKFEPRDIILAGDSAGGQLVAGVLAHSVRPCRYTKALPLKKGKGFGGAVMISPFVRMPPGLVPPPKIDEVREELETSDGSYEYNARRDYLTRGQVDQFNAELRADTTEVYANPCVEDKIWREEVFGSEEKKVVEKVLVTVGTAEVFLDCCRFFAENCLNGEIVKVEKQKKGKKNKVGDYYRGLFEGKEGNVLIECEGEVHVQPALDSVVGYKDGLMNNAIMAWLEKHFGGC